MHSTGGHMSAIWKLPCLGPVPLCLIFLELLAAAPAAPFKIDGKVGGNVSIPCPTVANEPYNYFYLQKENEEQKRKFVNGFYESRDVTHLAWANTRLDHLSNTTVHMFNLTVDHSGRYSCHFGYKVVPDEGPFVDIEITANYSPPNLSESGRSVRCESHGGYPMSEMQLRASRGGALHEGQPNVTQNQDGLFDVLVTAVANCSGGEFKVDCMIDGLTDTLTVCQSENKQPPGLPLGLKLGLGISGLVLVVVLVGVLAWYLHNRGNRTRNEAHNGAVTYAAVKTSVTVG